MFRVFICFAVMLMAGACDTSQPSGTVLLNARIVDAVDGTISEPSTIVLNNNRIAHIYSGTKPNKGHFEEIIDLGGAYVMPGLINGHIHMSMSDDPKMTLSEVIKEGVTTVRDLAGPPEITLGLMDDNQNNPGTLPDIYFAALIAGEKHREFPPLAQDLAESESGTLDGILFMKSMDEVEPFIQEWAEKGASGLKLYTALTEDQLEAISRLGEKQGLKIWTHSAIFPANATAVANSRPTEIIHTKGLISTDAVDLPDSFMPGVRQWIPQQNFDPVTLTEPRFPRLFSAMTENNIALNPALIADGDVTMEKRELAPWQSAMRDWACAATGEAKNAGVMLTAGTDYDGGPGLLKMELNRLTECGLTPAEAIRAATLNNAIVLGIDQEVGTVETGKKANLLILDQNPIQSIQALQDIKYVIKDGLIVNGSENKD